MDYNLPDGFRWTGRAPEYLEFEHIASEKRGAVSHCERAVTPDAELQGCIDYACARLLREVRLDGLWELSGHDLTEFHRLKNFQEIK